MTGFTDLPILRYEDISKEYEARGIDLTDIRKSCSHFTRWARKNKLPATDAEGKHLHGSKIFYQQYLEAPDGMKAKPAFVNFWHMLLKVGEEIPWQEGKDRRDKIIPVIPDVIGSPERPSFEKLAEARKNLETKIGRPLDNHSWEMIEREANEAPDRAADCKRILQEITEKYGVEVPGFGKAVKIHMTVEC